MDCQLKDVGYTAVSLPAIEFAANERTLGEDGFRVRFAVVEAENGDDLRFAVVGPNDERATLSDEDAIRFIEELHERGKYAACVEFYERVPIPEPGARFEADLGGLFEVDYEYVEHQNLSPEDRRMLSQIHDRLSNQLASKNS